MPEQKLRELLAALHEELQGGEPIDEQTRGQLRGVLTDIEARLARGARDKGAGTLADRVREATLDFEGSHPKLTLALEEMATVLSKMGI